MKKLYIKQKVFSIGEKFTVTDDKQRPCYFVEGSFFKIPKEFVITAADGEEVSRITRKVFSLLPKFFVEINGQEMITLTKELTFFKARYTIDGKGIDVQGNWWDMDFDVYSYGKHVASINKRWVSWGDTYEVTILDENLEGLLLSLVVAIDAVKADENASASSSSN
ncbi:MAG TPA: LURP-one-related family protein [Candidatus Tetragenococcus pullicola]|nr:LURP-one-related family protein [Candidatus Tetragenococcus pullicola]